MQTKSKAKPAAKAKKAAATTAPAEQGPSEEFLKVIQDAKALENQLEQELLRDAVLSARMALEELHDDTHGPPYERRRGIRLREKAVKVERAFNRLRALRLGLLLPQYED